jgi:hypothetical protein
MGGWSVSEPQRFRKKPVVIEAMQWDGTPEGATPIIDWVLRGGPANGPVAHYRDFPPRLHSISCRCDGRGIVPGGGLASDGPEPCPETEPTGGAPAVIEVQTLEGTMRADAGDWIIRGVQGEHYPIKDPIFRETYEAAE